MPTQCLHRVQKDYFFLSVPNGSRTRVAGVKGRCPRPLDDGDGYGKVVEIHGFPRVAVTGAGLERLFMITSSEP